MNSEVGIGCKKANEDVGKPGLTEKFGNENSDFRGRAHKFFARYFIGM